MKRVVIDINSVLPLYSRGWVSGIGRTTKELVDSINKMENLPFEIVLYSQNTKGITANELNTGFESRHLSLPHKPLMNRIIGMTHLREILTRYDLLHIPHNFEWVRNPEKTVVTIHDAMFFAHPDEVFNHEYAQKVYPRLARRCRAIITCSESSKRDIMHYMDIPEERIHVCPWGYNQRLFYPEKGQKRGYPFFLMVSCSMGRKNTMSVIKAYEQFVKQSPKHELVLVWPNTPREALDYCNKPHLRNHIYISSGIEDERLSMLYNEATATFFPSRYEGFGLPVLESMACGTPVVTCKNSALTEVGGAAALYVDPDDIDGMCRIMEQFEQGDLKKTDFTEQCLQQASHFSWDKCASRTVDVYSKCLESIS
ncbi:MAG: glycosyltransferase family 4 protein [Bacteroidales bacterium]|nr:glycosyltransferase family 4 protein [Bacteroidales bacterium]